MDNTKTLIWMLDDMECDKEYDVADVRQRRIIFEIWDMLHSQKQYFWTFSNDYKQIKKRKIKR